MTDILIKQRRHSYLFAVFAGLFILCLLLTFPSAADVYRYVEEKGIIHFSDVRKNSKLKVWIREEPVHFLPGTDFTEYDSLIAEAAHKYGVDFALVKAVIKTESNFNHKAISKKGAKGLMQLMPRTASILGVNDCFHPEDNIIGGIRHLGYLIDLFNGNIPLALAAYNAGEGTVVKYRGIPPYPETRIYIRRVLDNYDRYKLEAINATVTVKVDQ
ncbi:MAG TPA: lytic transglycosylase domain-containing protein [Syntrophales bacterium]|nr:lytic transglycosylase domain-containing protein [Syntrophales bacterium]